jgi:hypothetical protein
MVEQDASLRKLLALTSNIILGWKWLTVTNTLVIKIAILQVSEFVKAIFFHPSLIFYGKAKCLPEKAPSFDLKYYTRMEMAGSDKCTGN